MTIKDAENLTGLTAKSIRLYESKGLVTVDRNEENDYRNYTEENINQLKRIKVYRYFDFSIDEIKELLNDTPETVSDKIQEKLEKYEDETEDISSKRDLLDGLSKDLSKGKIDFEDYADTIEFLEGEDISELRKVINELSVSSLTQTILSTLAFCGPIGWLFINIATGMNKSLVLNAVLALISTVIVTLIWINFLKNRKQFKAKVKRKNKEHSSYWIFALFAFGGVFASIIYGTELVYELLAPDKWLFFETHQIPFTIYIFAIICIAGLGFLMAKQVIDNFKEIKNYKPDIKSCIKGLILLVVLWCVSTYLCLMNTVFVTEDSIIVHSPFNIKGTVYSYNEVEKVITGFGDGGLAPFDYQKKGNFYYKVKVDGKTLLFTGGQVSEDIQRYMDDTYLELEEFDQKIMEYGAEKESSEENYEDCFMDKEYVDRFLRIVNNK